ncbi:ADP-ribosylation factor-like protein 6, partial [Schistosoma japonicum]
ITDCFCLGIFLYDLEINKLLTWLKAQLNIFSCISGRRIFGFSKKEVNVLVIGLDNSGKSTILNKLQSKETQKSLIIPTVGYSSGAYRDLWEKFYKECEAIIYVVDSSDELRLIVVEDELHRILKHPNVFSRRIPILFFANKMDQPNSLTTKEIVRILGLENIKNKPWKIFPSNAISGNGLNEGLMWLFDQIKQTNN